MAKTFVLDFHGTQFTVPKVSLFNLLEHQPELVASAGYEVQSPVALEVFQIFAKALNTGANVPLTKENVGAISLLARELWLGDLLLECSAFQLASSPELIAALCERISQLERQMSPDSESSSNSRGTERFDHHP
jgi:hypothetical protein